ncbi:hypothetical protein [Campylobacter ureolyticus]|uniref:hypothetical protein n=1 Tax=Campylobacter ureolyticus TaxID=827 RepID=UPI0022B3B6E4|nr:hypothetical protein [Campylobacter ureolyticus]MCZ6171897.1 hypothetical protein [Campylobacter ureolyticus]
MSIKEETLKILSDGKWHCTKCELPAAQAKTYQQLRIKDGYEFETDKKNPNYFCQRKYCNICKRETIHRKIKVK